MQKCKIEIKAENKNKYAGWLYNSINGKIAEIEGESGNVYKIRLLDSSIVDCAGNVRQNQWGIFKNDIIML
jgi:hypothetical protein